MSAWRRARLPLAVSGLAALGLVAAMLAHGRSGKRLGAVLGGCPLPSRGTLSADAREAGRAHAIATLRGIGPARARPALMFTIGETRKATALRWAVEHGVSCSVLPSGSTIACAMVPAALLPAGQAGAALDELTLRFDPSDVLVALVTSRGPLVADEAWRAQREIASTVEQASGPPFVSVGDEQSLARAGVFAQVRTEFRFRDYYASCTAARLGAKTVLYEEYMAVPE